MNYVIFMGVKDWLKYLFKNYGSFLLSEMPFCHDLIEQFSSIAYSINFKDNVELTLKLSIHSSHLHKSHRALLRLGGPNKYK